MRGRTRSTGAWSANEIDGEVIVVDNNSSDGSGELAKAAGATVIRETRRGYGQAYMTGLDAACGEYILMADGDLTYDFDEAPRFPGRARVRCGPGGRETAWATSSAGAMSWHHRYIGNPAPCRAC